MADGRPQSDERAQEGRALTAAPDGRASSQEQRNVDDALGYRESLRKFKKGLDTWERALKEAEIELDLDIGALADKVYHLSRKERHLAAGKERLAKEKAEFFTLRDEQTKDLDDEEEGLHILGTSLLHREHAIWDRRAVLDGHEEDLISREGVLQCTDSLEVQRAEAVLKKDLLVDLEEDIGKRKTDLGARNEAIEAETARVIRATTAELEEIEQRNAAVDREKADLLETHHRSSEELERRAADLKKREKRVQPLEDTVFKKQARWMQFEEVMQFEMAKADEAGRLYDTPEDLRPRQYPTQNPHGCTPQILGSGAGPSTVGSRNQAFMDVDSGRRSKRRTRIARRTSKRIAASVSKRKISPEALEQNETERTDSRKTKKMRSTVREDAGSVRQHNNGQEH